MTCVSILEITATYLLIDFSCNSVFNCYHFRKLVFSILDIILNYKIIVLFYSIKNIVINLHYIYKDENNKSKSYHIQSGRRLSKTSAFKGFTNNGVNKVGYERKKKTQKTKETQYVDADDHPFHTNEISHSGVVPFGRMGISYLV